MLKHKKLLSALLAAVMLFTVTGCGGTDDEAEDWKKQIESYQTQQKEAKERITELTDEIENQKKLISGEGGVPESNTENSVTGEIKETDSSVSESDTEQVEGESK